LFLTPFSLIKNASQQVRQYSLITANYWAFTLTDGALRMLVVLFFHDLGYAPLEIAMLFLFYEFFGVVTNLFGGWLGARWGLNKTMNIGLALQIAALSMLLVPQAWLTVVWVMIAQALSGIAKDLNKMSAKSAIKLLVADDHQSQLYRWVSILTGSKNTLKGVGFFLGAVLLSAFGFQLAVGILAAGLALIFLISLIMLKQDLGKASRKPKFKQLLSKNASVNRLSAARLFLFAARDVWFVVALPVYFSTVLGWSHWMVGAYFASWIILYGLMQTIAPKITGFTSEHKGLNAKATTGWILALCFVTIVIAAAIGFAWEIQWVLLLGLLVFGGLFAVNSSMHSYLIVKFANRDAVSMDVGFYYMANAAGRLLGTVLSGLIYQTYGLLACLIASAMMLLSSALISFGFRTTEND